MSADPILARLTRLHPKAIDLSLGRLRSLLAKLGDPQRKVPPVIHVAGTNGKGSTCAFLRAMLEAAGQRVHVYTSPHLVRFHERIRLAGELICDDALTDLLDEVERVNDGAPITFFEITTAAAFLAFARVPADVLVLEVGLGGKLDATNVIDPPAVSVITPVSMDHEGFLGDSLAGIAAEKAGILKRGVWGVIGRQSIAASEVIEAEAHRIGAPLFRHGIGWRATSTADGFRYGGADWRFDLPLPGLAGPHQIDNAGTAIAALERFAPVRVDEAAVRAGLARVSWPARMQTLTRGPLFDLLPAGWSLHLDGGHNPGAGEALAVLLPDWADRLLHLVVGMLETKDARGFLRPLAPFAGQVRTVTIPDAPAAVPAERLAELAHDAGMAAAASASVEDAVREIVAAAPEPARLLICGSLYLAGAVLAENG